MERRGIPTATPPWLLLKGRQLHEGTHLPPVVTRMRWAARAGAAGAVAAATAPSRRKLRYLLNIKTNDKPWAAA